jgi:hypothetical protein
VQIEDARSTRHQNQIGGLSGDYGGVGAMRGCVDNRQGRTSLVVSRALAIRLGCRDVTLGVSLSRLSAYVAEEACGSTSRTAMLRPRRSTATDRCSVIGLQSAVQASAGRGGFVASVMVMVVIADVRAIVIAAATAPIAIGPTVAITSTIAIAAVIAITIAAMIAIPIARHARHAIAIRTTTSVWSPMKANAAATGDQRDIGCGSR